MGKLDNYKKIQIILLVLIVMASIILIVSTIKVKRTENYSTKQTFSDISAQMKEPEEEQENDVYEDGEQDEDMQSEDTSWDNEEDAQDTEVDVEEEKTNENNDKPYYIKINYTANCITIYKKDSSGNYTIPVKALVCSTGTATPKSGVYKMNQKYRWHELNGGVYGQYCSRITGHILFHSVPYRTNSPDTLKYTAYDKLGTKASSGCIRLTTIDAMWIYNNCPSGTFVEFYSSSNPGPLGKPSAQKISSNVECRNWDPTDPTQGNPWHTYVPPKEVIPENNIQVEEKPEDNIENEHNNNEHNNENNNVEENNQNNNTSQNNETENNNSQNNVTQNDVTTNETETNENKTKPENNEVTSNNTVENSVEQPIVDTETNQNKSNNQEQKN